MSCPRILKCGSDVHENACRNMRPGPSTWPRPDCDCSAHCCGTQCLCRNTTGEPMHYCECGSPGCGVPPISTKAPCTRGTNPGRTHRFFSGAPVVPFGYGLSYSSFSYGITSAPAEVVSLEPVHTLLSGTASLIERQFPPMGMSANAPVQCEISCFPDLLPARACRLPEKHPCCRRHQRDQHREGGRG